MHGNQAAVRKYSKELECDLKESTIRTWKGKFHAEISRKRQVGETGSVTSLPVKKRGRPLLLGEELDAKVTTYIKCLREGGGVVTTAVTMACATALLWKIDRCALSENGGSITITANWAKSLLHRMGFVKRKGSSTMKLTVTNFEVVKKQFLFDVKTVLEMEEIPPELVFNWDHTAISIVPGSSWSMELKGSQRVNIAGISDKRQITAVLCGTLAGDFLPPQLIYQGESSACLPQYEFPKDWHMTYTANHWANEHTMKEYLQKIIIPFVNEQRTKLKCSPDQPALALFDAFRGQQTENIAAILEEHNILA